MMLYHMLCTLHAVCSFPMLQKVKVEIQRMEKDGAIERVTHSTEWCTPMVPFLKKNTGTARICADLTKLNKLVKRKRYIPQTR